MQRLTWMTGEAFLARDQSDDDDDVEAIYVVRGAIALELAALEAKLIDRGRADEFADLIYALHSGEVEFTVGEIARRRRLLVG